MPEPTVVKMDINQMSAIYISVSSQTDDLVALRTKVEDDPKPLERQAECFVNTWRREKRLW